jgi:XRE family transcriptional regulator, regulator of sulfur utilization
MSAIPNRLGRVIRFERERRQLSQEALSELAGMNRSFVGEIERGEATPTIVTLQKLADALGLKLSELITRYEEESE